MNLDADQTKVVNARYAPLTVVMSGPGSGKTRVAVERAMKSLKEKRKVAVITYTNAAAHEFEERLRPYTGGISNVGAEPEFIGTLHSYCFRLIRKYGHLIGYFGNVSILPEGDRDKMLERIRSEFKGKMSVADIIGTHEDALTKQIWDEYQFTLKRNGLVDYDRILADAVELLQKPEVTSQVELDDLIVDEYQDSAEIDQLIYRLIPSRSRFFIGDLDQAIFEFRGAHPKGLLHAAEHAEVFKLEKNYRCSLQVCQAANNLIRHNKARWEKDTIAAGTRGGCVIVEKLHDQWQELETVALRIREHKGQSIAVLCRTNWQVEKVTQYLPSVGIKVSGLEERRRPSDWKRAMLLVGLFASPMNDYLAEEFLRLDHPKEVDRWKLEAAATRKPLAFRLQIGSPEATPFAHLSAFLQRNDVSYETAMIVHDVLQLLPEDADPSDLLQALHTKEVAQTGDPDGIFVGTMHSAKGREFDVVFLPMFEDLKIFDINVEEERRLVFVALTRARYDVHITWAQMRTPRWGEAEVRHPSRFIEEIKGPINETTDSKPAESLVEG